MRNLHQAKNLALKVEFMMQDRERYESFRRSFCGDDSQASVENGVTIREPQPRSDRYKEDRAAEK